MKKPSQQKELVPFLKWAGGKRWLIKRHRDLFPNSIPHLIEPFCGSSAVFFSVCPERATLSDTNVRLIEAYKQIRDDVEYFIECFDSYATQHSESFYYELRKKNFSNATKRAAQFVYLNRVCFNGIYRENLSGEFNVPIGSKESAQLDTDDFVSVANALVNTNIVCCDFEKIIDQSTCGDFLYLDPPYVTKHNFNGFAKYNQKIFSWADQKRLSTAVCKAHKRGVSIVLSNANHEEIRELYKPHLRIISLERFTVVASNPRYRGKTTEMVATNVL